MSQEQRDQQPREVSEAQAEQGAIAKEGGN